MLKPHAWITGRRRSQGHLREKLQLVEKDAGNLGRKLESKTSHEIMAKFEWQVSVSLDDKDEGIVRSWLLLFQSIWRESLSSQNKFIMLLVVICPWIRIFSRLLFSISIQIRCVRFVCSNFTYITFLRFLTRHVVFGVSYRHSLPTLIYPRHGVFFNLRRLKINPLAYWDLKDVWKYIEEHHATLIDSHTIPWDGVVYLPIHLPYIINQMYR